MKTKNKLGDIVLYTFFFAFCVFMLSIIPSLLSLVSEFVLVVVKFIDDIIVKLDKAFFSLGYWRFLISGVVTIGLFILMKKRDAKR